MTSIYNWIKFERSGTDDIVYTYDGFCFIQDITARSLEEGLLERLDPSYFFYRLRSNFDIKGYIIPFNGEVVIVQYHSPSPSRNVHYYKRDGLNVVIFNAPDHSSSHQRICFFDAFD